MSPCERYWRKVAEICRGYAQAESSSLSRSLLEARAQERDAWADLVALEGANLSIETLFAPRPGDLEMLRGEV